MRATRIFTMIIDSQTKVRVAVAPLGKFLRDVEKLLRIPDGAVTVQLVPGAKIAGWNRRYRGKARATDVLSFPVKDAGRNGVGETRARRSARRGETLRGFVGFGGEKGDAEYLGDVAICPEVAQRNAREFDRDLGTELRILILHGVLHLLGYDHETDTGQMERRERKLRNELGLA